MDNYDNYDNSYKLKKGGKKKTKVIDNCYNNSYDDDFKTSLKLGFIYKEK